MTTCPDCKGSGSHRVLTNLSSHRYYVHTPEWVNMLCATCQGTGTITEKENMTQKTWEADQFDRAVKIVKQRWGNGFHLLGNEIQQALVRAEAAVIIAAGDTFATTPQGRLAELAVTWSPDL